MFLQISPKTTGKRPCKIFGAQEWTPLATVYLGKGNTHVSIPVKEKVQTAYSIYQSLYSLGPTFDSLRPYNLRGVHNNPIKHQPNKILSGVKSTVTLLLNRSRGKHEFPSLTSILLSILCTHKYLTSNLYLSLTSLITSKTQNHLLKFLFKQRICLLLFHYILIPSSSLNYLFFSRLLLLLCSPWGNHNML